MKEFCKIHNNQKIVQACKICQKTFCFMCAYSGLLNQLSKNEVKHELIDIKDFNIMFPNYGNEKIDVNCEDQMSLIQKAMLLHLESYKEIKEIRLKKEVEVLYLIKMIKTKAMKDCMIIKNEFFKFNQYISHRIMEAKGSLSKLDKYKNKLVKIIGNRISKKEWKDLNLKLDELIKSKPSKACLKVHDERNLETIHIYRETHAHSIATNVGSIKVEKRNRVDNKSIFSVYQPLCIKGTGEKIVEECLKNCLKEVKIVSLARYFEDLRRKYLMHKSSFKNELKLFIMFSSYVKEFRINKSYRHMYMKYTKLFELLSILQKLPLIHWERKSNSKYVDYYFLRIGTLLLNPINSPFLFHLELIDPESIMHIKNLETNKIHKIYFYPRNIDYCYVDCEQFRGFLFCIGGFCIGGHKNELLKTCWGIELFKLPVISFVKSLMKMARSCVGVISTINNLYIIGGKSNYYISNCEKYDLKSNQWIEISHLNNNDSGNTLFYNSPFEIYTCGGACQNIYEKLNINPSISDPKWEILQISNTSRRWYGIAYQISKSEVLLFGGEYAPNEFVVFDFVNRKCTNQGKQFVKDDCFNTSKCRLFNNLIQIVSYRDKHLYKIDIKNMTFEHSAVDF